MNSGHIRQRDISNQDQLSIQGFIISHHAPQWFLCVGDGNLEPAQMNWVESGVFYTDGVTEAMSPKREPFERNRLAEVIAQNESLTADGLIQKILQSVNEFAQGNPLADDATLVVCKVQ